MALVLALLAVAVYAASVVRYQSIGVAGDGSYVYVLDRLTGRVCVVAPPQGARTEAVYRCIKNQGMEYR